MSTILSTVTALCNSITSDKPSCRRTAASKLGLLVKDTNLAEELEASYKEGRGSVTWEQIIHCAGKYVCHEVETKSNEKAYTYNKRHKEAGHFYQSIVQTVNKCRYISKEKDKLLSQCSNSISNINQGSWFKNKKYFNKTLMRSKYGKLHKAAAIFNHMLNTFANIDKQSSLINIYSNLMVRCLMQKKCLCEQIDVIKWHKFVSFYLNTLDVKDQSRRLLWARVLKKLFSMAIGLPYINTSSFVELIAIRLKESKHIKDVDYLNYMLCSWNSFIFTSCTDTPILILKCASSLFPLFKYFWTQYDNYCIKEELLRNFNRTINTYFLAEKQCSSLDAHGICTEQWHEQVENLFEMLYIEFSTFNTKRQFQPKQSLLISPSDTLQLMVAVMKKMLTSSSTKEIDIIVPTQFLNTQKRVKRIIKTPWDALFEGLQNLNHPDIACSWHQIFQAFILEDGIKVLAKDQLKEVLLVLKNLFKENLNPAVRCEVMNTLVVTLDKFTQVYGGCETKQYIVELWDTSLIILGSYESGDKEPFLSYLSFILKNHPVRPDFDIFLDLVSKLKLNPSTASCKLLYHIMKTGFTIDGMKMIESSTVLFKDLKKMNLRRCLIDWLLPKENERFMKLLSILDIKTCIDLASMVAFLVTSLQLQDLEGKQISPLDYSQICCLEDEHNKIYKRFKILTNLNEILENDEVLRNTVPTPSRERNRILCVFAEELLSRIHHLHAAVLIEMQEMHVRGVSMDATLCCRNYVCLLLQLGKQFNNVDGGGELVKAIERYLGESTHVFLTMVENVSRMANTENVVKIELLQSCFHGFSSLFIDDVMMMNNNHALLSMVKYLFRIVNGESIFQGDVSTTYSSKTEDDLSDIEFDSFEVEASETSSVKVNKCSVSPIEKFRMSCCSTLTHILIKLDKPSLSTERKLFVHSFQEENSMSKFKAMLFIVFMKTLENSGYDVELKELSIIITTIQQFLKNFKCCQEICLELLSSIIYLVKMLLKKEHCDSINHLRSYIIKIIQVFWSFQKKNFCCYIRIKLCNLLNVLAKIDDDLHGIWKIEVQEDNNQTRLYEAPELLCKMLTDENLLVRITAGEMLADALPKKDSTRKKSLFIRLRSELESFLMSSSAQSDEFGRVLTALITLKEIILKDPFLEKCSVWSFVELAYNQILQENNIYKVMTYLRKHFSYTSMKEYIESTLEYTILHYTTQNCSFEQFPSAIYGMKKKDFFENYYKKIVPYLVWKKDVDAVKNLHKTYLPSKKDWKELLLDSVSLTTALVMPEYCICLDRNACTQDTRLAFFYSCIGQEETFEDLTTDLRQLSSVFMKPSAMFQLTLKQNLEEIVFNMLLHIDTQQNEEIYLLPSNVSLFHFTIDSFHQVMNHISSCFVGKVKNIELFIRHSDTAANILNVLVCQIYTTQKLPDMSIYTNAYKIFVIYLLENIETLESSCASYIIREVLYRCFHLLAESWCFKVERVVVEMCFALLNKIYDVALYNRLVMKEFKRHQYFTITQISQFTDKTPPTTMKQLFEFLDRILAKIDTGLVKLLDGSKTFEILSRNKSFAHVIEDNTIRSQNNIHKQTLFTISQPDILHSQTLSLLTLTNALKSSKSEMQVSHSQLQDLLNVAEHFCAKDNLELKLLAVDCLGTVSVNQNTSSVAAASTTEDYTDLKFLLNEVVHSSISKSVIESRTALFCLQNVLTRTTLVEHLHLDEEYEYMEYIKPFTRKRKAGEKSIIETVTSRKPMLLSNPSISAHGNLSTEEWLMLVVTTLLSNQPSNSFFVLLHPLCNMNFDLSKKCFPFILMEVLQDAKVQDSLDNFFNLWVNDFLRIQRETTLLSAGIKEKMVILINVVIALRRFPLPETKKKTTTSWDRNFWLNIDYYKFSEASLYCCLYEASTLFNEISSDHLWDGHSSSQVGESCREKALSISKTLLLLSKIYTNIGDCDLIYGIGVKSGMRIDTRTQGYELEKKFHKALLTCDVRSATHKSTSLIPKSLVNAGLYHTALLYLNGLSEEQRAEHRETQFEAAWRNSVWNETELSPPITHISGFHKSIYHSLSSLNCCDTDSFYRHLQNSKLQIVQQLSSDYVTCYNSSELLAASRAVSQLQKAGTCFLSGKLNEIEFPKIEGRKNFDLLEPSLSIVVEVLKIASTHVCEETQTDVVNITASYIRSCCKAAREAGRFEIGEKFISQIHLLEKNHLRSSKWKLEEAKLFWARDEKEYAMCLLEKILKDMIDVKKDRTSDLYPIVMSLYGHWCGESKSKNPVVIIEEYLEPAIRIMEEPSYRGDYTPIEAYHSLAKYADTHHTTLVEYANSEMFERKKAVIKKSREDLSSCSRPTKDDNDLKRHLNNLEKQCRIDEREVEQVVMDQNSFLKKAFLNYIKCLQCGDKYDTKILRLSSLWFENYNESNINSITKNGFSKIESRKFLPVMYQLAARLGTTMTSQSALFKEVLEELIMRCIRDHPHHSMFILLALSNADADEKAKNAKRKNKLSQTRLSVVSNHKNDRVKEAKGVIERLRHTKREYVENAERLAKAYIELAYWDITHLKLEKGPFELPQSLMIRKIKNMDDIAIPTVDIPVDPSCSYPTVPSIIKFESTFGHAGGINLPKILSCKGSDGKDRRQLIKGRDDLRQDAVMQQVFGLVNILLSKDVDTKKRYLNMRTYKVVPLSQKSGLMEWCDGTIPLGNFLIGGRGGSPGAHERYYPTDWSAKECRKQLLEATAGDGRRSKHKVYLEIEKNFHPVFRHFFLEKFLDPSDWFLSRLRYTRSVAVCSFVGYILGLGDRHCQNILIDCTSAELVHIDLGVAFEQGKILPTPETVPFRLTRDIVDGMGTLGVEGVFRRCSEKTLAVLKKSQESIITIVEVLLYDPLHAWTLTTEKANRLQTEENTMMLNKIPAQYCNEETDLRNKMAERVILRLKQKLSGSESGAFLGIDGQVNFLIEEATNTHNLCMLYPGWQPWL